MDNRYSHQRARGRINPPPRCGVSGVKVVDRHQPTPLVIKEYIVKYSNVTPVYIQPKVSYFSSPKPKKPIAPKKIEPEVRPIEKHLARTSSKAILLSMVVDAKKERKQRRHRLVIRRLVVGVFLVLILGTTGYVSLDAWQTNIHAKQVLSNLDTQSSSNKPADKSATTSKTQFPTGVDAKKPSVSSLSLYKVASDLPRAIYINKINVSARLMPMGLNSDRSLQAPSNIYDAGWYNSSAKPGQPGAMLVDGHASETGTNYGLFGNVINLKVGDQISVERGDGVKFNYSVAHTEVVPLSDVDMSKLQVTYGGAGQGINLIACTGKWTSDKSTLDHRVLVYATLQ